MLMDTKGTSTLDYLNPYLLIYMLLTFSSRRTHQKIKTRRMAIELKETFYHTNITQYRGEGNCLFKNKYVNDITVSEFIHYLITRLLH